MQTRFCTRGARLAGGAAGLCLALWAPMAFSDARAGAPDGREIFNRQWKSGEKSRHGGDGLGPMYNDVSCVACHFQGGVGGSGPNWKNVEMLAVAEQPQMAGCRVGPVRESAAGFAFEEAVRRRQVRDEAARLHPGFTLGPGVVLHVFSSAETYRDWRRKLFFPGAGHGAPTGQDALFMPDEPPLPAKAVRTSGGFTFNLTRSQRNTPALFGAGLIDDIPDWVLHQRASQKIAWYPEVSGRVALHPDGKLGRFGWKGQTATLQDFVHNACAVEMGLSVPGKPQVQPPHDATYEPPGLDLDGDECRALVSFVAGLPSPKATSPQRLADKDRVAHGAHLFGKVGCATCHVPKLGNVQEIYSDLLLHDMGSETADVAGGYGGSRGSPSEPDEAPIVVVSTEGGSRAATAAVGKQKRARPSGFEPPKASEWRTPPLWGVADSAPYLHDGRAATLEEAILAHRGEAARSTSMFNKLPKPSQQKLVAFLKSLKAPQPLR